MPPRTMSKRPSISLSQGCKTKPRFQPFSCKATPTCLTHDRLRWPWWEGSGELPREGFNLGHRAPFFFLLKKNWFEQHVELNRPSYLPVQSLPSWWQLASDTLSEILASNLLCLRPEKESKPLVHGAVGCYRDMGDQWGVSCVSLRCPRETWGRRPQVQFSKNKPSTGQPVTPEGCVTESPASIMQGILQLLAAVIQDPMNLKISLDTFKKWQK
jgi:hypothetical protein